LRYVGVHGNVRPVAAPTAKSLILDLLSTLRRGSMPVRALVAAGALFDLDENNIRVALARLLSSGLVARDERGRYRLGERAEAVGRQVSRWRSIEQGLRPWNGAWVAVLGADRRAERPLHFLAFRELTPGLHVRPDNLAGGVAAVRQQLETLGLPADVVVAGLANLDDATEARARALWDTSALRAAYRDARARLVRSERRLARLAPATAMAESFLLGGEVLRQLALDPRLPDPLVPSEDRAALVETMRRYDRLGRSCWAGFMREFEVLPEARAPVDARIAEGPGLEGHPT
jgi:phenylacetic acid degradation operon negative regulatory protein